MTWLGIGPALCWGSADFLAGRASRASSVLNVILISQAVALLALAGVLAIDGAAVPHGAFFLYAILAGLAEACGLAAFYSGLALGATGVVAPISATAGVVPMVVGLAGGDPVSALQVLGTVAALLGIAFTGLEFGGQRGAPAAGVGLALVAAGSFGLFFVAMSSASHAGPALWAVCVDRVTMVALIAGLMVFKRPRRSPIGFGGDRLSRHPGHHRLRRSHITRGPVGGRGDGLHLSSDHHSSRSLRDRRTAPRHPASRQHNGSGRSGTHQCLTAISPISYPPSHRLG